MKNVLTIAGHDPSCGAGVEADIKTFSAMEVYGLSVGTALTVQNTSGVFSVVEIDEKVILTQLHNLAHDIEIHAIKIGMLYSEKVIEIVASFLEEVSCKVVVLDPVLISKNGFWLLKQDAQAFLIKRLLPLITLITPNIKEAQLLANLEIKDISDIEKTASIIKNFGPKYVLIKGARVSSDSVTDLLFDGSNYKSFATKNLKVHPFLHGTGCTFASSITAQMAKGFTIEESIKSAQSFLYSVSLSPLVIGKGNYNLNHLGILQRNSEKYNIIHELKIAFEKLRHENIGELIPEVQSNLVFAMDGATNAEEVAGFPGRIVRLDNSIAYVRSPEFGKKGHMSSAILAVMHFFPFLRSSMNIKYSPEIIKICGKNGFIIYNFERKDEPEENKDVEGKTLNWGIKQAIEKAHNAPDIIYDTGGHCKEPIIRVIGNDPDEVVKKIILIKNG